MTQQSLKFGSGRAARRRRNIGTDLQWPEILAADPQKYPGLSQEIAMRALHRQGKPHRQQDCPLCQLERKEEAA